MQTEPENPRQTDLKTKVESGEFFREAQNAYANVFLDPMSERYMYLVITVFSLVVFFTALVAIAQLYPLSTPVPFGYVSNDVTEELPVIKPLPGAEGQDANTTLKLFLSEQYVILRQSYDIATLELNVRAVKNQSTQSVFDAWQRELDPANPESPISRFERHSTREVRIIGSRLLPDGTVEVAYDEAVKTQGEAKKTRMLANVAFTYADVTIDQQTGATTKLEYTVTDFRTRRLQE